MVDLPLVQCYDFLRSIDHELSSRVAGLESAVNEYNTLLHRIVELQDNCVRDRQEGRIANDSDLPIPPLLSLSELNTVSPHADRREAVGGDELHAILEKAKNINLIDRGTRQGSSTDQSTARSCGRRSRHTVTKVTQPQSSRGKVASQEDEIDRILRMARRIRGQGQESETVIKKDLSSAPEDKVSESIERKVPQPPPFEGRPQQPDLIKVDCNRVEKMLAHLWTTDRAVHRAHIKVLSAGAGCAVFPRSIPYLSFKSAVSPTGLPEPPTAAIAGGPGHSCSSAHKHIIEENKGDCYKALAIMLRENRIRYTKYMKRLLREGGKVSQIGPADREELFKYWYEHQALLELYEVLRLDRVENEFDYDSKDNLHPGKLPLELLFARDAIAALPKATPIDFSAPVSKFLDPSWLNAGLTEVDLYNDVLKTRTKYAAETVLGRTVLKECIHRLKKCTWQSRRAEVGDSLVADWTEALKLYRSVWSCLSRETPSAGRVSFVYK